MNHSQGQDFKKQRQKLTVNIRKEKRQQNFQKKRRMNNEAELNQHFVNNNQDNQIINYKTKHYVLDEQRRQIILKAIQKKYFPNKFGDLVKLLYSTDLNQKHQGLIGIRKIVSSCDTPPTHLIFQFNILDYVVQLLKQTYYPHLRLQATWIISNIAASSQRQHVQKLMEKNILEYLVQFLMENKEGLVDQAIWAVGNISGDSAEFRDMLIEAGAVKATIHLINVTKNRNNIIHSAWVLSNLCRGTPLPEHQKVKQSAFVFCKILQMNILDLENLSDCLWALSYLLQGPKQRLNYITSESTINSIIQYTKSSYMGVAIPSLRILGTISTGNQSFTQLLLKNNILSKFQQLIDSSKSVIRRQVCWIFSNIAAGNKNDIDKILEEQKLIQKVLRLFQLDSNQVKRQICYIFANMTYLGDKEKVRKLIFQKDILRLYAACIIEQNNQKLIQNCLDTFPMLFQFGEKIKMFYNNQNMIIQTLKTIPNFNDAFQNLQYHNSNSIASKVSTLISRYFEIQRQVSKQMDAEY